MRLSTLIGICLFGVAMQEASFITGPFITPAGVRERPFQAQFEIVALRESAGGETSKRVTRGAVYRATDGRSRREEYAGDGAGRIIKTIIIHDPTKHEGYLLDAESKTFFRMPIPETTGAGGASGAGLPAFDGENLGKKVIDGLTCRGYRRQGPGSRVVEYWVAEELLEAVWARSAGGGEETLRYFDVRRGEPDAKLFTVPADYKAVKLK